MKIIIQKATSAADVQACLDLRKTIFVEGQQVPLKEEVDGQDHDSDHYLLLINDEPAGVARVRYMKDFAKIERVGILDGYQGRGFGKDIMSKILLDLKHNKEVHIAKLSAQTYAIPFYEKLGFMVNSEEYIDANIPHKDMLLKFKQI